MMFRPEEIEMFAERLHDAWARKKIQQGWKYGPVKDEKLKTHPDLIPYKDLPEEKKELDRMYIRNFEAILKKANFEVVRGEKSILSEEDIEKLAEESHNLWLEKADPSHPYYKPYKKLPEEAKELNRNTVRELLQILSESGFGVRNKNSLKQKEEKTNSFAAFFSVESENSFQQKEQVKHTKSKITKK